MVDWRGHLRALGAAVIALPLVWAPPLAFAGWDTFTVVKKPNGGTVVAPSMRSLLRDAFSRPGAVQSLPGGGVNATAPVALPVGNTSVGATGGQALSRGALLRGAARVAVGLGPGLAIAAALEFVRCRDDGTSIAGIIECDPLTDPQPFTGPHYRWTSAYPWVPTRAQACEQVAAAFNSAATPMSCQGNAYTPVYTSVPHPSGVETHCLTTWQVPNLYTCALVDQSATHQVSKTNTTTTSCVPPSAPGGPDGKCTTPEENWIPEEDLGGRFLDWRNQPGWPSAASDDKVAQDLANAPDTVDPFEGETFDAPSLSGGPATADGGSKTSTKINADGTKTQTTTTTTHNITYNQNNYTFTTTTTTIIQNFDQNDDPLGPPITEEQTETPPAGDPNAPAELPEDLECGLPGYPPCKIDETGTPSSVDVSQEAVNDSKADALEAITGLGNVQAPAWSWTFALPSGCTPIVIGPFAGHSVGVDLCEWQPMIHDIVSLIWIAAAIWGCVGLVGRTLSTG